jgi:hypothetical protein
MQQMAQLYDAVVRDARAVDSQEGTPEVIETGSLTDLRLQ